MESQETFDPFPRPGHPDFTNFPKHLQDDTIDYDIFWLGDETLSPAQTRTRLVDVQSEATASSKELFKEYIWQRDSFSLTLDRQPEEDGGRWHLHGSTEFGDSIADEWAIVYLLRQLSIKFNRAWLKITDSDGEFLLIEAANVLPKWLNPEVADNRVWINKGQLRLVPQSLSNTSGVSKQPQSAKPVTLPEALAFISSSPQSLIHSPLIEEEAFFRLRNYPAQIKDTFHRSRISIPRRLAFVLHRAPAHISAAVESFFLRDHISLRPLQYESAAKLHFPPEAMISLPIKFTRVGFAQLKSQEFSAPYAWKDVVSAGSNKEVQDQLDMGMKLSCGFEMFLADPQKQKTRPVQEIKLLLEDIDNGDDELPTNAQIAEWPQDVDDEKWLDVNYEDFENELNGQRRSEGAGFGDANAQDNLRRMVERFEQFLNDDSAGAEGVEFEDDMDYDDDDDDDDDDEFGLDEGEDENASFNEDEFADMMRQMMGMPSGRDSQVQEVDSDGGAELDPEEIKKLSEGMERELRAAGALTIDGEEQSISRKRIGDGTSKATDREDPRYILAKNLMESFKEQGGMAGPAGSLLGSMGLQLPRDEGDERKTARK